MYQNSTFGLCLQSYEYVQSPVLDYKLLPDVRLAAERGIFSAWKVSAVLSMAAIALKKKKSIFIDLILTSANTDVGLIMKKRS